MFIGTISLSGYEAEGAIVSKGTLQGSLHVVVRYRDRLCGGRLFSEPPSAGTKPTPIMVI